MKEETTPIYRDLYDTIFLDTLSKIIVAAAPTGTGKSYAIARILTKLGLFYSIRGIGNGRHIIGGPTLGQIMSITYDNFEGACKELGVSFRKRQDKHYTYYEIANGLLVFRLLPGENENQWRRGMGDSITLGYVEEAAHCKKDYIDALVSRGRYDESKTILATNADSPYNHIKIDYLDRQEQITGFRYVTAPFGSNPFVGAKQMEFLKNSGMSPHMIKRLINNVWVPAEGLSLIHI